MKMGDFDVCNKKNTMNGFEGLQGLWTGGGGGWDFRPDRFFFGKNQGKKFDNPFFRQKWSKVV
jgi:hypothetical protein